MFGEETMAQKMPRQMIFTLACALIVAVVVGSLVVCFTMAELPTGKVGLLAKLDPEQANPKTMYHALYGSTPIVGGNYSVSPPVSMYRAIDIGLGSDGWTAQSLWNMTVRVSLDYYIFYSNATDLYRVAAEENLTLNGGPNPNLNCPCSGAEFIRDVTSPVPNYQPQFFNCVTLRYLWIITVLPRSGGFWIPPPGYYQVDAATGALIPTGPLF